nr:hypothetical protein Cbor_353 [Cedratvirus borely]
MEIKFEQIKYEAYYTWKAGSSCFSSNPVLDIVQCKLVHGNYIYKILPVCTFYDGSLKLFDKDHPMGISYPLLDKAIQKLELDETCKDNPYQTGFMLSALVCKEVQGQTFLSICSGQSNIIWVIILGPGNNAAKRLLALMKKRKTSFTREDADGWYQEIGWQSP